MSDITKKCIHELDKIIISLYGLINDIEKIRSPMDDILLVKKENINRIASKIQLCKQRKITNIKIECQHSNIYQTNNVYQFFMADEDKKN